MTPDLVGLIEVERDKRHLKRCARCCDDISGLACVPLRRAGNCVVRCGVSEAEWVECPSCARRPDEYIPPWLRT